VECEFTLVIKVTNSLTGKLEELKPFNGKKVRIYVCGLTVQGYAHIGHARTYVAFDVIKRYLKFRGYNVFHVQNITDIDDKIIARANERGLDPIKMATDLAMEAEKDLDALGIEKADVYPRVTEHIPTIIELIERLIKKGYAYEIEGDVFFAVDKFADYGHLSHQSPKEVLSGARIEVDERKRNPADFALWKSAKEGEPSFESPWGRGRPGWHIECSAMSIKYLGERYEIHGGGKDLVFPHHENEIAQSEAATGKKPFVKYWLHTGLLNLRGEKMSKSLGNFITIRDLLKEWDPDVFRMAIISAHYSNPIEFHDEVLQQAEKNLTKIRIGIEELERGVAQSTKVKRSRASDEAHRAHVAEIEKRFIEAMDNDFNTPQALVAVQDIVKLGNKALTSGAGREALEHILEELRKLVSVVGFSEVGGKVETIRAELTEQASRLIRDREEARKRKDWKKADEIRDQLKKMGITIEDTAKGTKWKHDSPA
jgi:cysteinyl-tRNA synthetase